MAERKYSIHGMTCAACQATVEHAIAAVGGVNSVSVSLLSNSAAVSFDGEGDDEAIFAAVKRAGYSASPYEKREVTDQAELEHYRSLLRRFIISAVFAVIMMYVTMGHMVHLPLPAFMDPHGGGISPIIYAGVQFLLTLPVIAINHAYFTDGWRGVVSRSPNMNTLVATGAAASMIYGIYIFVRMIVGYRAGEMIHELSEDLYFESVTMILTLITLGRTLEARARRHTSDAVRKLLALAPKTAEVIKNGEIVTVDSDSLEVGNVVVVRAGGSVPCDGIFVKGGGSSDESVITGESIPVVKELGDTLICGTVLVSGYAEIEATHVGEDTTVAKITELVENAASTKAPQQKSADKISRVFVPVVCAIAAATFVLWLIFSRDLHTAVGFGISVLVISCPCALGLATPTAVMCGIGRGATLGILIKSADYLDTLGKASVAVFDKTGTITEGRLTVSDVFPANGITKELLLSRAASLEQMSEHPIGAAIVDRAAEDGIRGSAVNGFEQAFGGGIKGEIDGCTIVGGNAEFTEKNGISLDAVTKDKLRTFSEEGKTAVIFSENGKVIGVIALSDAIKPSSSAAVSYLRSLGIDVVMLTGDNKLTARAIAAEAGIESVVAEVKPDEKAAAIESIMAGDFRGDRKRRHVIMVGDGVNDAPALAMADCGIAVARGTDIAIESAGVVLAHSDLTDVPRAVELSRAVMRNINENLIWAFGYNVLCIPIAAGMLFPAFGIALTPMIASAAMSLSSVCVVTNALRLKLFKPKH